MDRCEVHQPSSFLLRFKSPKSGDTEGELVDLFSFHGNNCCPVLAFGLFGQNNTRCARPFLAYRSSTFPPVSTSPPLILTKSWQTSCLTFAPQARIPSLAIPYIRESLALSSRPSHQRQHQKGWGRWKSECYTLYTLLQLGQREQIFPKSLPLSILLNHLPRFNSVFPGSPMAPDPAIAAACQPAGSSRMAKESARTRASFKSMPGLFPSDPPPFPSFLGAAPCPVPPALHYGGSISSHPPTTISLSPGDIGILRLWLPKPRRPLG